MRNVTIYLDGVICITMSVNKTCSNDAVYEYLVSKGYSTKIIVTD